MLKFGIIGTGRISDWVLKGAAQDSRIKVTAVCSRTVEAAEAFGQRNTLAAGAMIYVVVEELIPEMNDEQHSHIGMIAFAAGFSLMMIRFNVSSVSGSR